MLKKIKEYKKKSKRVIDSLIDKSEYLESGGSITDTEFKYLYRNEQDTSEFMNKVLKLNNYNLSSKASLKKEFKKFLLPRNLRVINETEDKDFSGSIFLLSNDNSDQKDVKIFDIKKNKVLTVYVRLDSLNKKIANNNYFSPYFNIPEIISYDLDKKISVEELIISKPKAIWNEMDYSNVIKEIFSSYKKYYEVVGKSQVYSCSNSSNMLLELKKDNIIKKLAVRIEKEISQCMIDKDIPMVNQHGDLWLYNTMLCENGNIYFIDWEHSGKYFLFFDLFWWMQNEAIYNSDMSYVSGFLSGSYDDHFYKLFSLLDYNYIKEHRKDYFLIFIIELLYKRYLNNTEDLKKVSVEIYSTLLDKLVFRD